ncbi:hypothetical protein [Streptomyces sp. NRRL S-241]|uniref:hypothetical protein n=1 Tax=Streptomyces sp. NRRL S-241 TaxID=1463896 RepID=UPI0004C086E5|nr:hypothetical protein [Streptomyces sp. NRRL S-241]
MGENENVESGSFEELISGIETQMNAERLHKQAAYVVTAARIAGTVLTEAVASGVPYELSKEMAADTWNSFMGFQAIILDEVEIGDAVG